MSREQFRLADRRLAGSAIFAWVANDPHPRALAERDGLALWCNPAAQALFADGGAVVVRGGYLAAEDRREQPRLERLLQTAAPKPASAVLRRTDGECDAVVRAMSVPFKERDCVALQIRTVTARPKVHVADTSSLFALTTAETAIVCGLLNGATADAIAEATGVSTGTVRKHIRNVYSKLSVSSREGLFARLIPYIELA